MCSDTTGLPRLHEHPAKRESKGRCAYSIVRTWSITSACKSNSRILIRTLSTVPSDDSRTGCRGRWLSLRWPWSLRWPDLKVPALFAVKQVCMCCRGLFLKLYCSLNIGLRLQVLLVVSGQRMCLSASHRRVPFTSLEGVRASGRSRARPR